MTTEEAGSAISMKLINDSYAIVYLLDVLCSSIFRNLNMNIPINDKFTLIFDLNEFIIQTIHDLLQDAHRN